MELGIAHIKTVRRSNFSPSKTKGSNYNLSPSKTGIKRPKLPPKPCVRCGALRWDDECYYKNKKCNLCDRIGHKSSHCRVKPRGKFIKKLVGQNKNVRRYVQVKICYKKNKNAA